MKKLYVITLLLSSSLSYGSTFTQDDAYEISSHITSKFTDYSKRYWQEAFKVEYDNGSLTKHVFRLKSGIDCEITHQSAVALSESSYSQFKEPLPSGLTGQYQSFTLIDEPKVSVQLKHTVGKDCTEKFKLYDHIMNIGFVTGKPVFIKEGSYQITDIKFAPEITPLAKRTLFQSASYSSSDQLVIRYSNPQSTGNNYSIFLKDQTFWSEGFGSESLVAEFKVNQVSLDF